MNYEELFNQLRKTKQFKEVKKICKKLDYNKMPYYYLKELKTILEEKRGKLTKMYPNFSSFIVMLIFYILLVLLFPSSYLTSKILKIIAACLFNRICFLKWPKIFAVEDLAGEVAQMNLDLEFLKIYKILNSRQKKENSDFLLTQESNREVIRKLWTLEEENGFKLSNEEIKYNINLINKLNECLEITDKNEAWQLFNNIENQLKVNPMPMMQNFSFNVLPKYFLLLIAKYKENMKDILNQADTYILALVVKYLCEKENYALYDVTYFLTSKEELIKLCESLIRIYLINYHNSKEESRTRTIDSH